MVGDGRLYVGLLVVGDGCLYVGLLVVGAGLLVVCLGAGAEPEKVYKRDKGPM